MLAFARDEVERIRQVIGDRGPAGHRDLALFNLAIDTMISVTELLNLTVKDVKSGNGSIRSVLEIPRSRGKQIHRCALSKATMLALKDWLASSGLKRSDFLFPGRGGAPHPLAARNLNRSIRGFVLWSIAFSTVSCLVGIYAPMRFDLPVPSGGAIILTAAAIFLVTMVIRMMMPRYREASL